MRRTFTKFQPSENTLAVGDYLAHLKLVHSTSHVRECAPTSAPLARDPTLSTEASILESWRGKNPYSEFLKKHEQRPDKQQARIIACLMDARLRDNEGNLQPPLPKSIRARRADERKKNRIKIESWQILSLIAELAQHASLEPVHVVEQCYRFSSSETISAQVQVAIEWLTRFDSELQAHESQTFGTT